LAFRRYRTAGNTSRYFFMEHFVGFECKKHHRPCTPVARCLFVGYKQFLEASAVSPSVSYDSYLRRADSLHDSRVRPRVSFTDGIMNSSQIGRIDPLWSNPCGRGQQPVDHRQATRASSFPHSSGSRRHWQHAIGMRMDQGFQPAFQGRAARTSRLRMASIPRRSHP